MVAAVLVPDKNLDNVDEATEKFKEIQASFAVLNDPVLRGMAVRTLHVGGGCFM
jgi:curved DNA-binding protein CbpA